MRIFALLFALGLFCLMPSKTIDVSLPDTMPLLGAGLLEDPKGSLAFEEVRWLDASHFVPLSSGAISFGFTPSTYWFRATLHNPDEETLVRLLAIEPTWLDRLELWVLEPDEERQHQIGGDHLPYADRLISHPRHLFELRLAPGESTLFVRVQTRDPFVVFMRLLDERTLYLADANYRLYLGLIYGALMIMMLYNLLLYGAVRDRIYGFYALYVGSFVLMNYTYSGLAFATLWPAWPEFGNWAHSVLVFGFCFSGLVFAMVFLDTRNRLPGVHRFLLTFLAVSVIIFAFTAMAGYAYHVAAAIFMVIAYSLVAFTAGIIAWLKGNTTARFFILATTAGLSGAAITALTVAGFIPFSLLTFRAADIGMVLDALLLSIALADRYRALKNESEQLRIKAAKQEGIMLRQYQQAKLGNMISVIAHQMKQPLTVISLVVQDLTDSIRQGELKRKEVDRSEQRVLKSVTHMSQTIDQFRNYFRPDKTMGRFPLANLLNETRALLDKPLSDSKITFEQHCPPELTLTSHIGELQQVILNLLSNAIDVLKSRHILAPRIRLEAEQIDQWVTIRISDNGGGLSDEALKHLFELFFTTKGEEGTGIGLHLCRTLIAESLGGTIEADNRAEGACFTIRLPAKHTAPIGHNPK